MITKDKLNLYSTQTLTEYIIREERRPRLEDRPCSIQAIKDHLASRRKLRLYIRPTHNQPDKLRQEAQPVQ